MVISVSYRDDRSPLIDTGESEYDGGDWKKFSGVSLVQENY